MGRLGEEIPARSVGYVKNPEEGDWRERKGDLRKGTTTLSGEGKEGLDTLPVPGDVTKNLSKTYRVYTPCLSTGQAVLLSERIFIHRTILFSLGPSYFQDSS